MNGTWRENDFLVIAVSDESALPLSTRPAATDQRWARYRVHASKAVAAVPRPEQRSSRRDSGSEQPRNGLNRFHSGAEAGDILPVLLECTVR